MTSGNSQRTARQLVTCLMLLLLAACGPNRVQVEGIYPAPLVDPIPVSLGVWFPEAFRNHEFYDEAKTPGTSDWIVHTGAAQVRMWETLLKGVFAEVVILDADPSLVSEDGSESKVGKTLSPDIDAIFVPSVEELQYAIPAHTNIKVYEIWLRYRLSLQTPDGQSISEWSMTSYGKTPTAFLQSDEEAVNFAAIMALRDAGANFTANFAKIPEVKQWLASLESPNAGADAGPAQSANVDEEGDTQ